jgi:hypothetical protein
MAAGSRISAIKVSANKQGQFKYKIKWDICTHGV